VDCWCCGLDWGVGWFGVLWFCGFVLLVVLSVIECFFSLLGLGWLWFGLLDVLSVLWCGRDCFHFWFGVCVCCFFWVEVSWGSCDCFVLVLWMVMWGMFVVFFLVWLRRCHFVAFLCVRVVRIVFSCVIWLGWVFLLLLDCDACLLRLWFFCLLVVVFLLVWVLCRVVFC